MNYNIGMTIRNEMSTKFSRILDEVKPPLKFELITSVQQAVEYLNAELWSWELNEEVISEGLDRHPHGYLFFGLRLNNEPAAITIFKRHARISQEKIPVLTSTGELRDPQTMLTLKYLTDFTNNSSAVELGDTYLRGFQRGDLGIFTPFRYGRTLIFQYLELIKAIRSFYPEDHLLVLPHGIYEWDGEREKKIIEFFQQRGGSLSIQDYLDRFNTGNHYIPDAQNKIGTARPISKMSERMIKMSGIPFGIVGYAANDFGPVYLAQPINPQPLAI